MSAEDEARRKLEKPRCSAADVVAFVRANFTLDGGDIDDSSVVELNSYDDRNYYVKTTDGSREYTLKVHNGVESRRPTLLAAQSAMMRHLDAAGVPVPVPVKTDAGKRLDAVGAELRGVDADDVAFLRLPSPRIATNRTATTPCASSLDPGRDRRAQRARRAHPPVSPRRRRLPRDARRALVSFHHPGAERRHLWDNANVLAVRDYAEAIEDPANRELAESVFRDFETKVMPHASTLRRGVCQNDANDQNVVVRVAEPSVAARYFSPGRRTVDPTAVPVGLLDFGDIVYTWRVNEIAISMAYFALGKDDPVGDAGEVLAGFEATFPLTDVERRLVPALVAARLVCSCACGAYSAAMDPDNAAYLLLTQRPGWAALRAFRDAGTTRVWSGGRRLRSGERRRSGR